MNPKMNVTHKHQILVEHHHVVAAALHIRHRLALEQLPLLVPLLEGAVTDVRSRCMAPYTNSLIVGVRHCAHLVEPADDAL